jgi:hypothetical protein
VRSPISAPAPKLKANASNIPITSIGAGAGLVAVHAEGASCAWHPRLNQERLGLASIFGTEAGTFVLTPNCLPQ